MTGSGGAVAGKPRKHQQARRPEHKQPQQNPQTQKARIKAADEEQWAGQPKPNQPVAEPQEMKLTRSVNHKGMRL